MPDPAARLTEVLAALRAYDPERWLESIAKAVADLGGTDALDLLAMAAENEASAAEGGGSEAN
jgi:hypothetical protein